MKILKKLFNIISVGDLVEINSNCKNTKRVIYQVYCEITTSKGIKYAIYDLKKKKLKKHLFTKEELILL